uniref:Uncharacterized protein n=1 Tax=Setaria italica TaxID=4555 RepID=K3ZBM5_SETIT
MFQQHYKLGGKTGPHKLYVGSPDVTEILNMPFSLTLTESQKKSRILPNYTEVPCKTFKSLS